MISGLAPGSCVVTRIVGKSTCGNGATGSSGYATTPTSRIPAISSEVAIGRAIKALEMLISSSFTAARKSAGGQPLVAGLFTSTRAPGCRRYCPAVTTCSPTATPSSTMATPSLTWPTLRERDVPARLHLPCRICDLAGEHLGRRRHLSIGFKFRLLARQVGGEVGRVIRRIEEQETVRCLHDGLG